jgi:hypothetical protein
VKKICSLRGATTTQPNDTHHNDIQHNSKLNVTQHNAEHCYMSFINVGSQIQVLNVECHYATCHCVECRGAVFVSRTVVAASSRNV